MNKSISNTTLTKKEKKKKVIKSIYKVKSFQESSMFNHKDRKDSYTEFSHYGIFGGNLSR